VGTPQETDERLRRWLDANQLARERLCHAILSLDKRFTSVRTRHPRGGPDGGRDLDATFQDGRRVFGAVGFVNSASDSPTEKTSVAKKFTDDLETALAADHGLKIFVFFTNVSLTLGEKKTLAETANAKGIETVDVFDRERMRIALDSTDGLAARHQYLDIKMSDGEQAAFFARWGDDLEELITRSVGAVDSRLDRIQFIQEQNRPLHSFSYHVKLNREMTASETPYLRALMVITFAPLSRRPDGKLHMLVSTDHGEWQEDGAAKMSGYMPVVATTWGLHPAYLVERKLCYHNELFKSVPFTLFASHFGPPILGKTLGNLDQALVAVFVNRSLADAVDEIAVIANEYVVWKTSSSPEVVESAPSGVLPVDFTSTELANDPWVELKPAIGSGWFDFSRYTPRRLFPAEEISSLLSSGA
jgi:hypothetical protein